MSVEVIAGSWLKEHSSMFNTLLAMRKMTFWGPQTSWTVPARKMKRDVTTHTLGFDLTKLKLILTMYENAAGNSF